MGYRYKTIEELENTYGNYGVDTHKDIMLDAWKYDNPSWDVTLAGKRIGLSNDFTFTTAKEGVNLLALILADRRENRPIDYGIMHRDLHLKCNYTINDNGSYQPHTYDDFIIKTHSVTDADSMVFHQAGDFISMDLGPEELYHQLRLLSAAYGKHIIIMDINTSHIPKIDALEGLCATKCLTILCKQPYTNTTGSDMCYIMMELTQPKAL